jgi:hypothetical protein
MELQNAHLSEVQQAVAKTASSVDRILRQQTLHEKLHHATGKKVLQTEKSTEELLARLEGVAADAKVYEQIHETAADHIVDMRSEMRNHMSLHMQTGRVLQDLSSEVGDVKVASNLSADVHDKIAERMLHLARTVEDMQHASELSNAVHEKAVGKIMNLQQSVENIYADDGVGFSLWHKSDKDKDKEKKSHKQQADEAAEPARAAVPVACVAGDDEMQKMKSEMQRMKSALAQATSLMQDLVKKNGGDNATAAAEASVAKHERVLSVLQNDISSSNGKKKKKGAR